MYFMKNLGINQKVKGSTRDLSRGALDVAATNGVRSGVFDEDVGLLERLPVASAATDRLLVAVAFDVADEDALVRELALELRDRVQLAAVVVHRRHVDLRAYQLHLLAVGVNDHGQDVEELETEGILRHLELRHVAGLDLLRRALAEERARIQELDVRLANVVHVLPPVLNVRSPRIPRGTGYRILFQLSVRLAYYAIKVNGRQVCRPLGKNLMKKFLLPLQNMVRADLFSGSLAVCTSLSEATISSFSLAANYFRLFHR